VRNAWVQSPLALALALSLTSGAVGGIRLDVVSDPPLPAQPVRLGTNLDFEQGLDGWINKHSNEVAAVEMQGHGKAFRTQGKNVYRNVNKALVIPGHTYILSCDIKPSKEVSSVRVAGGGSGLGCGLAFWSRDWKQATGLNAYAEGPDAWFRVSSASVTIPDWICYSQLTVGLAYTKGSGYVDNIELTEAFARLQVSVSSSDPIWQVKVVDDRDEIVFDTGLIGKDAGCRWSKELKVETSRRYRLYAVDRTGDVAFATCPHQKEP